jgi:hypothetical protein
LTPGTIFLHRNFVFEDGTTKDKFLIVVGAHQDKVVTAKTTSRGHRYRNDFGCQAGNRFPAFLLTLGCCCFQKNTWVCLGDFYEMDSSNLQLKIVSGEVFRYGVLDNNLTRDIQFCAKNCDDITEYQEGIIDLSLAEA